MYSSKTHLRMEPLPAVATCGECGCRFDIDYWPIVNTETNPDTAEKLRSADLFRFTCPNCGVEDLATYRNVYHDVANRFIIMSEPPRKKSLDDAVEVMDSMLRCGTYADFGILDVSGGQLAKQGFVDHQARITTHPAVQAEKARIAWNGFDDRVLELVKILACGQLLGEHELFGSTVAVFWGGSPGLGRIRLKIVGEDMYRIVGLDYYLKVKDTFRDSIEKESGSYFVDRDWALKVLGWLPEESRALAKSFRPEPDEAGSQEHDHAPSKGGMLRRLLRRR